MSIPYERRENLRMKMRSAEDTVTRRTSATKRFTLTILIISRQPVRTERPRQFSGRKRTEWDHYQLTGDCLGHTNRPSTASLFRLPQLPGLLPAHPATVPFTRMVIKPLPQFHQAQRHEDVWGEWRSEPTILAPWP
jgi:hypothetical protein